MAERGPFPSAQMGARSGPARAPPGPRQGHRVARTPRDSTPQHGDAEEEEKYRVQERTTTGSRDGKSDYSAFQFVDHIQPIAVYAHAEPGQNAISQAKLAGLWLLRQVHLAVPALIPG